MGDPVDKLNAMAIFVRVVERGSFSAVARELQTSQPTISKVSTEPADKPTEAEVFVINSEWTTPYLNYLLNDELPEDRAEAECIA